MSLKKRSFSLSGHRTSVALEEEFWAVLDQAAKGSSLAALVGSVAINAGLGSVSSRRRRRAAGFAPAGSSAFARLS